MKIHEEYKKNKPLFSFEIFPPKKGGDINQIYNTIEEIAVYNPSFISVTYGAAGSERGNETIEICRHIKDKYDITPLMHLTCAGSKKEMLDNIFEEVKGRGIENVLLMRGDKRADLGEEEQFPSFKFANELIEYARSKYDFSIGGACYPEGHIQAKTVVQDLFNLRNKVQSGANFLVSQFFFDNDKFYKFVEDARSIDINVPIFAGIMPVLNKNQINRMVELSGASLPEKFKKVLNKYENSPDVLRDAGIAYASEQIVDLLSSGVDGIHLYVMNKPIIAKKISENIGTILNDLRKDLNG